MRSGKFCRFQIFIVTTGKLWVPWDTFNTSYVIPGKPYLFYVAGWPKQVKQILFKLNWNEPSQLFQVLPNVIFAKAWSLSKSIIFRKHCFSPSATLQIFRSHAFIDRIQFTFFPKKLQRIWKVLFFVCRNSDTFLNSAKKVFASWLYSLCFGFLACRQDFLELMLKKSFCYLSLAFLRTRHAQYHRYSLQKRYGGENKLVALR